MTLFQKSVKVVKDYFFTLALVATFVGFSAFKYAKSTQQPESGWYTISVNPAVPNDQNQQTITGFLEDGPQGDCNPANTLTPCAVLLDLDDFDESTIINMTVLDATDNHGAEIDENSGGQNDGYSRRDE